MSKPQWDIWVDTGGTFTDAVGVSPEGQTVRAKVLSTGTLRARVGAVESDGRVRLEHSWGPWAELPDAAAGWELAAVRAAKAVGAGGVQAGATARIVRWSRHWVELAGNSAAFTPGTVVELRSGHEAPILAARLLTLTPAGAALPPIRLRLATTRGTNALLTGAVSPTALVINRGLGDLLRIGTQQRADLFALDIRKAAPLHAAVIEVAGRLDATGAEVEPLGLDAVKVAAREAVLRGVRDAAVCLLHADLNPAHEDAVAGALLDAGMERVTRSSRVAPFVKILPRATTALVNACLSPVIDGYLSRVRNELRAPGCSLLVMTSAGGLSQGEDFLPKDSLLSGPAAGVVGAAQAAAAAGFAHAVSFDMWGTSTDAARWSRARGVEYVFEHTVGAATLIAPAAAVETVAAGGGSICSFRDGALRVGPESAGASPGPACYGAGGPLTLTDVNLLLGRLCPQRFVIPVDRGAAERAAATVLRDGHEPAASLERVLEGFLEIAAERMAGAVQRTSTRRGHDLRGAALVAFGGAGGQHACAIAVRLGLETVLVPRDAGLLSARGLGAAAVERFAQRQVLATIDAIDSQVCQWLDALGAQAIGELGAGLEGSRASIRRRIAAVRFAGQETALELDLPVEDANGAPINAVMLRSLFAQRHAEIYGFAPPDGREIELVWLRVIAGAGPSDVLEAGGVIEGAVRRPREAAGTSAAAAVGPRSSLVQQAYFGGQWLPTPVIERERLCERDQILGPAIVTEDHCTIVVEPGWQAEINACGDVVLKRAAAAGSAVHVRQDRADDPASIELFTARFESLACEMGEMLARTSVSVNVKERLDFSCALLDPRGWLIACAPHVPVHLGSLGVCVRAVTGVLPLAPGDSAITNHPALGGSHLPDVTVVTAVHDERGTLLGYVASRAHHAEMGGRTPGSMPPDARALAEEGVVLAPFKIVEAGRPREELLEAALRAGPYPSRNVADNLADVRAALAANARGAAMLRLLGGEHGAANLHAFMEAIQLRSERLLRARIAALPDGQVSIDDAMDDGSPVRVRMTVAGDEISLDFTGSAPVHPGNLNATPAIVASCVVYVMRVLLGAGEGSMAPLNEGLLRPVRLILPEGMLNPPFAANADPRTLPAVVGGNVETSQRVVDVLLRALGLCASSQGTMNNLVFGGIGNSAAASYYETICGGAGAGQGFAGASAVHTHMTNTRITDPEILERRYPVRLERFAIRSGSGGGGEFCGGEGVERVLRFLSSQRVSLLTQRRTSGPPGLRGGAAGAAGRQTLTRADGTAATLPSIAGFDAHAGDVLTICTPGGGGYGSK